MSEARVITPSPSAQSFFSSFSIRPTSTGMPNEKVSATSGITSIQQQRWSTVSQPPPGAPVARQQFVRFIGAPGARGVKIKSLLAPALPLFLDRVDKRPRLVHFITAREQSS